MSNSSAFADSDLSSEFAYVYIGQEPNLKADQLLEQGKDTGLLIHWGAIVSSKLYRKSSLDNEEKLLATFGEDMTKNYYEDTALVNGVTYTYTLKLFTEYKGVEYSDTIALTMPNPLESPVIEAHTVNSSEVSIKWSATADADYYTVYRKSGGVWQNLADSVTGTGYAVLSGIGDYDGSIIKTQTVKEGETPPKMQTPYREGYEFERWDKPIGKVC